MRALPAEEVVRLPRLLLSNGHEGRKISALYQGEVFQYILEMYTKEQVGALKRRLSFLFTSFNNALYQFDQTYKPR